MTAPDGWVDSFLRQLRASRTLADVEQLVAGRQMMIDANCAPRLSDEERAALALRRAEIQRARNVEPLP